jgi:hypothetical protein
MVRHAVDNWTDTTAFRIVLFVSALAVLPVLAVGVLITVLGGAILLAEGSAVDAEQALFGALSTGGAIGIFGYLRAQLGARRPDRHDMTSTLICLGIGVVTALAVAGFVVSGTLEAWSTLWNDSPRASAPFLFAAANLVWALSGIAWMQRLPRRYAEKTGRRFDTVPVIVLFVAIALLSGALLMTITL